MSLKSLDYFQKLCFFAGCNLKRKISTNINVFFHNLGGFDCHLIFEKLCQTKMKLKVLATSFSDIISFRIKNVVFKDSLRFLNTSLEKLTENLHQKNGSISSKFPSLCHYFTKTYGKIMTTELLNKIAQKQWFPYHMIHSFEDLENLLPIAKKWFVNELSDERISDNEYKDLQDLWATFSLKTVGQFFDFYLSIDVLLLADVFTHYRQFSLKNYGIEPCTTFGAPGLR